VDPASEIIPAKLWLALRDGKPVGRITGIINHTYLQDWENRDGRFGSVDFIDDAEGSSALIDVAEKGNKRGGMTAIHGPLGFSDTNHEGLQVKGFDEPGTMATIPNHPRFRVHTERRGYRKGVDWVEFEIAVPPEIPEKAVCVAALGGSPRGRTSFSMLGARRSFSGGWRRSSAQRMITYKDPCGSVSPHRETDHLPHDEVYFGHDRGM
jgi:hypothetical protein